MWRFEPNFFHSSHLCTLKKHEYIPVHVLFRCFFYPLACEDTSQHKVSREHFVYFISLLCLSTFSYTRTHWLVLALALSFSVSKNNKCSFFYRRSNIDWGVEGSAEERRLPLPPLPMGHDPPLSMWFSTFLDVVMHCFFSFIFSSVLLNACGWACVHGMILIRFIIDSFYVGFRLFYHSSRQLRVKFFRTPNSTCKFYIALLMCMTSHRR